jgi:hypothetical protein
MRSGIAVCLLLLCSGAARADNCGRSFEYIMNGSAGDVAQTSATYRGLLDICTQTLKMSNVKDAYVLKDGGIAVVPKDNSVAATASTLAEFCEANPRKTLRFLTKKEMRGQPTTGLVVSLSSNGLASCPQIRGEQ